jgi:hypothetical protein
MEALQDAKDTCGFWDATNKCFKPARKAVLIPERMLAADGVVRCTPVEVLDILGKGFETVSKAQRGNSDTGFLFDELFKADIENELASFELENARSTGPLDSAFSTKEYLDAVMKMKNGKAGGIDEIIPEFIKSACQPLIRSMKRAARSRERSEPEDEKEESPFADRLMYLYNQCLEQREFPAVLKEGEIRALFKSGETQLTQNYRPITLLSYVGKNLGSMIAERLQKFLEATGGLADEQGGFRKGRSQVQQISTLMTVIRDRKASGLNTAVIFLDVNKAYDQLWRKGLLYKLKEKGVTGKMWSLVKSSLENVRRRMKAPGVELNEEIRSFTTEEGVTQGAPESPILYSVFINDLVEVLRSKGIGVVVGGKVRPGLLFADDIALIVESVEEVQRALRVVTDYARKWRFSFNGKKSAVMAWGSKHFRKRIKDEVYSCTESRVPVRKEYKYLGVLITEDLKWNRHVDMIILSCKARTKSLIWKITNGRKLRPRTAIYVWNSLVRPILEYASELWAQELTMQQEDKLEKIPISFIKKTFNLPRSTPTVVIRLENGLERMRSRWDKLAIGFLKKIGSMTEGRFARDAVDLALREHGLRTGWGTKIRQVLASTCTEQLAQRISNLDDLQRVFETQEFEVDKRENELLKTSASNLSSLAEFTAIKCWDNIDRKHAYAKTHVGRVASRYHEPYLDNWSQDKEGTRMKILARCGQLNLKAVEARRGRAPGIAAVCTCCSANTAETLHHFIMECPAYTNERNALNEKVIRALIVAQIGKTPGSTLDAGTFEALNDNERLLFFLGKRTDLPKTDLAIDRACRKYLKKAWEIRGQVDQRLLSRLVRIG